ncbi:hypothetical protein EVAR_50831_1 [Eumeta japonica]|uniref:Uncharacterized protein n=1 Tax=Eumeta variegata TaxID=151549 RepID=A0A4C1XGC3_EUMVA|nr:hypothetical protein EVAR_50831_1 [Eumeta japonica]
MSYRKGFTRAGRTFVNIIHRRHETFVPAIRNRIAGRRLCTTSKKQAVRTSPEQAALVAEQAPPELLCDYCAGESTLASAAFLAAEKLLLLRT